MNHRIVIIDYGVGNLFSLQRAFRAVSGEALIASDVDTIYSADALVLPGVGSFEAGMRGLRLRGLIDVVKNAATKGTPILGICLGAQLLLSEGHEFGVHQGLDIIPGKVLKFEGLTQNEKIPHVGWNNISPPEEVTWKGTVLDLVEKASKVYFVHSYILAPRNKEHTFGLTTYGGKEFCSIVKKGKIIGVQFHPEKSGETGLRIIKNFVSAL